MVVVDVADSHKNTVRLVPVQDRLDQEVLVVAAFVHLKVYSLDILAMRDIDRLDDSHVEAEDSFLAPLDLVHMAVAQVVGLYKFESLDVAGIGRCSLLVEEHCSVVYMEFVVEVVVLLVVEVPMVAMNMGTVKLEGLQLKVVVAVADHRQFHSAHL